MSRRDGMIAWAVTIVVVVLLLAMIAYFSAVGGG
jgi:hypothetical protein